MTETVSAATTRASAVYAVSPPPARSAVKFDYESGIAVLIAQAGERVELSGQATRLHRLLAEPR